MGTLRLAPALDKISLKASGFGAGKNSMNRPFLAPSLNQQNDGLLSQPPYRIGGPALTALQNHFVS
jgi:hypothetical protein